MVPPPSGYERLLLGHAVAVARSDVAPAIRRLLLSADGTRSTLHDYAAHHRAARRMQGRGAAYAIPIPESGQRIVVRHNHRGGLFGSLTRDVFLAPTRAPYELDTALRLERLGVPTPSVVAYALYPPGGILQRADVCSLEIPDSRDLADVLTKDDAPQRTAALSAAARLLASLAIAGARHHDLNAKNVLLTYDTAFVLDVDRVTLDGARDVVLDRNLGRLARSLRKWRDRFGASVTEHDIAELGDSARRAMAEQHAGVP